MWNAHRRSLLSQALWQGNLIPMQCSPPIVINLSSVARIGIRDFGRGWMVSEGVGLVRDILYLSKLAIPMHPWDRNHAPSSTITSIFKPQEHLNHLEAASTLHDIARSFFVQKNVIFRCRWWRVVPPASALFPDLLPCIMCNGAGCVYSCTGGVCRRSALQRQQHWR